MRGEHQKITPGFVHVKVIKLGCSNNDWIIAYFLCSVVGMKLKNTRSRSSNACRRLWSKQCSEGHNLRYIQEGLVNFTRGLAWDLICGLVNWTALQYLPHSLSVTSCVLFSQASFLVRDRRSSASHLSVSVGSSCGGGKCMFCFFVSLCVPTLTLGTKSTGTDMEKTEWDPTGTFPCHYFSFVWMEWNMPGGLEPLKSIYPGKRDKIQKTSKLPPLPPPPVLLQQVPLSATATPLPTPPLPTRYFLTYLSFPSNLERPSDLPCDSIIRWESLRQWLKRWFSKNLAGAYYRSFTQPTELKASLFLLAFYLVLTFSICVFNSPPPPLPFWYFFSLGGKSAWYLR